MASVCSDRQGDTGDLAEGTGQTISMFTTRFRIEVFRVLSKTESRLMPNATTLPKMRYSQKRSGGRRG